MLVKALTLTAAFIDYLGGVSRFSHGRYAPDFFYRYQLGRVSDNESTRFIPYADFAVATLILYPATRTVALGLNTSLMTLGVGARVQSGKNPMVDIAVTMVSAVAFWGNYRGWQ